MVYLREVKIEDAEELYEICKKEELTKFLTWYPHKDVDETVKVINNFYIKNKVDIPNSYGIYYSNNNKLIGVIDFLGKRNYKGIIEIGYFLDPNYWNLGIMTIALNKILDIGFNTYNYDVIGISHIAENTSSMKVIIKNGFTFIEDIDDVIKNKNIVRKYYEIERSVYNEKQS